MIDEHNEASEIGGRASLAEGLDAVLAALLLAKRLHVEKVSEASQGLARIDLSGDDLEGSLATLSQVVKMATQVSRGRARVRSGGEEGASVSSFWQALKEFALPHAPPTHWKK